MGYVSDKYLILIQKLLFFKMRVPLLGFRLCKTNETVLNGMNCMVTAKPWFIYGIKILFDRFLVSELA